MLGRLLIRICLLALPCCLLACEASRPRVIVVGFDGVDPGAVELLASEGRLPNFARLRSEGAFGPLEASPPLVSPVLWTTMATGRRPEDHGISDFKVGREGEERQQPITSTQRRVKAVWSVASDAGRKVAVVGWWATWPPEHVNGAMVSDRTCYHFLFAKGEAGELATSDAVYPPALAERVEPLIRRPADISAAEASRFISVPAEEFARPFEFSDELSHFRWALATSDSYRRIALDLWRSEQPDLLMLYVEGTDSVSHLFGHLFRAQGLAGELATQQQRYGRAVEEMYVWADGVLGELMRAMDPGTTLVVLSDHGFKLGELHADPSVTRDMRRVNVKAHDLYGIVGMLGRGVRKGVPIQGAKQLDVTPTILALLGLPASEEMPGQPLSGVLTGVEPPARVASYETGKTPTAVGPAGNAQVDEQVIAHLRALGYLEGGDQPAAEPPRTADLDILLRAGRYEEAVHAAEQLLAKTPDDAKLYVNLAYGLERLGRLDETLAALDRALALDPAYALAHFNRGTILERLGRRDEAVAAYRTAAQCDGELTLARQALERLTGSGLVYRPSSAEQDRASQLAAEAGGEARKGNYQRAMELLAEAEKLWSDCPLVFQYRANVAYLSGDLPGAIAALERAAALEPGNVAVRANLERLRKKRAGAAGEPAPRH